jgi:hypothetical protein
MDEDGTVAVNCVVLTKVVGKAVAFQSITELARKLLPFTASTKLGAPATAEAGEIVLSTGVGFGADGDTTLDLTR